MIDYFLTICHLRSFLMPSTASTPDPPPEFVYHHTGNNVLRFPTFSEDGKLVVHCDLCGGSYSVGPRGSTANFGNHRRSCGRSIAQNRSRAPSTPARPASAMAAPYPSISTRLAPVTTPSQFTQPSHSFTSSVQSLESMIPSDRPLESPKSDAISDMQMSDLSGAISHLSLSDTQDPAPSQFESRSSDTRNQCKGALVHWKPGNIWLTYSFAMHSHDKNPLPWELANIVDGTTLDIRSLNCRGTLSGFEEPGSDCCDTCSNAPNRFLSAQIVDLRAQNRILLDIIQRTGNIFSDITHASKRLDGPAKFRDTLNAYFLDNGVEENQSQ
ncbi:hypothetical protein C8R42DRAFT_684435 [Lentinula raphanica]|nr:hypothetical protein C8R42DRAFT_684435 [Lentinula raphanica]